MTTKFGKVLIIDDDEDILQAARLLLKKHMAVVHTEKNPVSIPNLMKNEDYDVILLDMNFTRDMTSGKEGMYWLKRILEIDPSTVIILITAYGDVELAVQAIKEGATDFVLKPWQNEKLLATINSAMNLRQSRSDALQLRQQQEQLSAELDQPFQNFIGACPAMQQVFQTIRKVGATDANVLILGENGTGKELVARELHRQSQRSSNVFISVDMGALTETLFESELFGYVKGAFTDAKENRAGRFEVASGGTIFLDEIGNLPLQLQAKLLTVLQNRTVTRVGSHKETPIDVRVICATNQPIYDLVAQKTFRQDLLFRINTVEIHLPPLRERQDDIPLLVDHFLEIYCKKYNTSIKQIHEVALKKMLKYHWPGNVRELQHAMERAVIMTDASILKPTDIMFPAKDMKEEGIVFDNYNLDDVEKTVIRKALQKHGGNISHAASELGLTRTSLYRRMEKYGL
ncbi:sigma-54-dependent Fis family transcriptional regulator [candidate division KSB1 bacterium]|nr:sigma-54-dependent Fis family transcriptional regulator [candidate division KSB1 bacterium]